MNNFQISLDEQNQLYDQFNIIDQQSLIHYYVRLTKNNLITNQFLKETQQMEIKYSQENDCLQIIPNNMISINLKQSDERQIIQIGTISQLNELMAKYPLHKFKYYSKYNSQNLLKITINQWNRGIRVSFPEFYPQGDNGGSLKFGTSVFTKGTDDQESKDFFCHRYYDFNMNIIGGNGNQDTLAIFAKRR